MRPELLTLIPTLVLLLSQPAKCQTTNSISSDPSDTRDGKARFVIEGWWPTAQTETKLISSATLMETIRLSRDKAEQSVQVTFDILSGKPEELLLTIQGDGAIRDVAGEALRDWSVRESTNGVRTLVLRPREPQKLSSLTAVVKAETEIRNLDRPLQALSFAPPTPALLSGHIKVEATPELSVDAPEPTGLIPIEPESLPEPMRKQ